MTLAYTGIRVGELCALKWKDIDTTNNTIRIYKTYYNPDNNTVKYELLPPKAKASRRTRHTHISLLAEAGASLEKIMDRVGHVDDSTTKNIYLHITKDMKKEASHKFSSLMKDL